MTAASTGAGIEPWTGADSEPVGTDEPFRLLVEQVEDYAIYLLDLRGRVCSWNSGAQRIKGYEPQEILGESFDVFFTEEERAAGKPARLLERAAREGRCEDESWRVRKDGTRFPASALITALRASDGRLTGFAKITRNISERLGAEESARKLAEERTARAQAAQAETERRALLRRQGQLGGLRADLGDAAATEGDGGALLERAGRTLVDRLGVRAARIWLYDERGDLRPAARAEELPTAEDPQALGASIVGRIAATGAPASLADLARDPAAAGLWTDRSETASFAGCPMMAGARAIGVLAVFGSGPLPDDTLEALRGASDLLAQSLERRRAEAEVRRSRDQLSAILASVSDGVLAHRPDGRLVFANDAAARLCGFASTTEVLSVPARQLLARFELRDEGGQPLPPDRLPMAQAESGRPAQATVRVRDLATGEPRWVLISSSPVLSPGAEVDLVVSAFTDLTARKRTEDWWRFLAEASAALGSSPGFEATLSAVARLAVPRVADWCAVLVRGPTGDLKPLSVADVDAAPGGGEERAQASSLLLAPLVAGGQPHLYPEIDDRDLDPGLQALAAQLGLRSLVVAPLAVREELLGALALAFKGSGRRYGAEDLMVAQEIARRGSLALDNARAYGEAREAVRMRDTFLSVASHELKTPLSTLTLLVSGLAHNAREGRLGDLAAEKLLGRLTRIENQADRLTELINQLLDVSRLAAGRFTLSPEKTDLAAVVREVIARFAQDAARSGAALTFEGPAALVGWWDPGRLDQIITNLVANAVKYAAGTAVTVGAASDGDGVRLAVRDRGPGIAQQDQARVFEQYERAASSNLGGLGLGLWIVKQLVEAHRGRVWVESGPGQGACFYVWLPRAAVAEPA